MAKEKSYSFIEWGELRMDARDLYRLEFCQQCANPCKQEGNDLTICLQKKITDFTAEKHILKKELTKN